MTNEEQRRKLWCDVLVRAAEEYDVNTATFAADEALKKYDERFGVQPVGADEGGYWLHWDAGECPVPCDQLVDIVHAGGDVNYKTYAAGWDWSERGYMGIVKYRLVSEK